MFFLTDALIVTKAEEITKAHKISDLKFSAGSSDEFKRRNFIKYRELYGESATIKDDQDKHTRFLTTAYDKKSNMERKIHLGLANLPQRVA